ncbi:MAG: DOMON-like domain-containing protein [Steroidobacteraceae bacterium]
MNRRVCQKLVMHPASRGDAVQGVEVAIAREAPGALRVSFRITGEIGHLRLPAAAPALRADGLWQHSCLEAFLRADDADSYHEFNFSPSGAWAAYRFAGRRAGRTSPVMTAPAMRSERAAGSYGLSAAIPLAELPDLARASTIHAGIAAVIEDEHGTLSYWAIAHAAPEPDFHDPATFTLVLPA